MARKTLYVIDGNSYLYRAFFAIPKFTTSTGHFTNATYGFTKMLMKVINGNKPDLLVVCFDAPGKSFRHETYAEYKATRDRMPDEMGPQIDDIKRVVDAFGIPRIEIPGVEADDSLGTIAKHYDEKGYEVFIVTSDKDIMQMVNEHVHVYDTMKDIVYTPEKVKGKMGVRPDQIIDLLALMGDTSDNIPGVQGVGPKTAQKLLEAYETLDGIYENVEAQKGKLKERLIEFKDNAYLSQELATVHTSIDVPFEEIDVFKPDWEELKSIFRELEFSSILKEIVTPENHKEVFETGDLEERNYRGIVTEDAFEKLLKRMSSEQAIAFDTETTSENPMDARLIGLSFSFRALEAYYVPVGHEDLPQQLTKELVLEKLRPLLEDPNIRKFGQNIKYDMLVLANEYRRLETGEVDGTQLGLFSE